jgi:hypothetical protein
MRLTHRPFYPRENNPLHPLNMKIRGSKSLYGLFREEIIVIPVNFGVPALTLGTISTQLILFTA